MGGSDNSETIGVVIIGRNEGDRLKRCINSLLPFNLPLVYVDSNSNDDSVEFARTKGALVIELDMSIPFTAARARNEGFDQLISEHEHIEFVQFVDGDCQINAKWFDKAASFMASHPNHAAVCGRRRELYSNASIYNLLCDIEWDTPTGDAAACGGDALFRVCAFTEVGGYCNSLIAGEEPELCFRLRQSGWLIHRLDAEMTLHDANMTTFQQWWKRNQRAGYAYSRGAWLHRHTKTRYNLRPVLRMVFWAFVIPLLILTTPVFSPLAMILVLIYPFQYFRLALNGPRTFSTNYKWAFFMLLSKFAELSGLIKCVNDLLWSRNVHIIEYK